MSSHPVSPGINSVPKSSWKSVSPFFFFGVFCAATALTCHRTERIRQLVWNRREKEMRAIVTSR